MAGFDPATMPEAQHDPQECEECGGLCLGHEDEPTEEEVSLEGILATIRDALAELYNRTDILADHVTQLTEKVDRKVKMAIPKGRSR